MNDADPRHTTHKFLPSKAGLSASLRLAPGNYLLTLSSYNAKFCGEHNLVALAFDRAADKFFVFVRSINVRSIEKVDAEFESAANGGDGFVVIASAVKLRHAHAAQAGDGDFETAAPKFAKLHDGSFCPRSGESQCARGKRQAGLCPPLLRS